MEIADQTIEDNGVDEPTVDDEAGMNLAELIEDLKSFSTSRTLEALAFLKNRWDNQPKIRKELIRLEIMIYNFDKEKAKFPKLLEERYNKNS